MKKILLTPGPTNIEPEILQCISEDLIHHRFSEYKNIVIENEKMLNSIFGNEDGRSVIYTSSGSGALEAIVENFILKDEKTLVISVGFFGQLFQNILKAYNREFEAIEYEWEMPANLVEIDNFLKNNKEIKNIYATFSETSTGILNDIESIGNIAKKYNCLFFIDAVSGAIYNPLHMSKFNVDVLVSASQKGFRLPPGISFLSFSERAFHKRLENKNAGYYFDILRHFELSQGDTNSNYLEIINKKADAYIPATSAIPLVRCLNMVLKSLIEKGISQFWKEQSQRYDYFFKKIINLGFEKIVQNPKYESKTLLVLKNDNIDINLFIQKMIDNNIYIAPGLGRLAGIAIRLGLLYPFTNEQIDSFVKVMENVINQIKEGK
ncbi:aspartate aminotransferase-like enzyme [Mycoplasma testudineum]|uniref:Aspartate aminotransferase-like enzyme n=1 Tax=Mycoplasma testudineum TaxID=244584 RepID=A0A4R6IDZ5_9MOLU|nr:aminotransferase class V-fold PLP-dependent enzyme [Mycoplasma testudineum]OYD26941.1 hypothetical protein CG473_01210 [Mycoplasma testudineum]TDO20490.1 aspartate aminotransferase-like enzyme [Mycoplasma testudineum]